MPDSNIAAIGRRLAGALSQVAYSRAEADKKEVAVLQMELCQAVRAEREEQAREKL